MIGIIAVAATTTSGLLQRKDQTIDTQYGEATFRPEPGMRRGSVRCASRRRSLDTTQRHQLPRKRQGPSRTRCSFNIRCERCWFACSRPRPRILIYCQRFHRIHAGRQSTFFDQPGEVTHTDMTSVYDQELRQTLKQAAEFEGQHVTDSATYVCVDGQDSKHQQK